MKHRSLVTWNFALMGCAEPDHWTEHLRIYSEIEQPLCEGNLIEFEKSVTESEKLLGFQVETPLDLHIFNAVEWDDVQKCDGTASGCFRRTSNSIWARFDHEIVAHEVVHAALRAPGRADPLFTEGISEALSAHSSFDDRPVMGAAAGSIRYLTSAHFVRWLSLERGLDCVLTMATGPRDPAATFERVCGSSFDDAVNDYAFSAPWYYPSPRRCRGPETLVANTGVTLDLDFDCERPDVFSDGSDLLTRRLLWIEDAGRYLLWTDAEAASLGVCVLDVIGLAPTFIPAASEAVPPHWQQSSRTYAGGKVHVIELRPGLLEVDIMSQTEADTGRSFWLLPQVEGAPVPLPP